MGNRPIHKQFDCVVKKVDDKPRTHRFIGTNQAADRFGDIIEFEGWDTANWEANPVILWNHKMDEPPIGRGMVRRVKDGKALVFDVEFASEEVYPFAATVEKLVDNGFINAVSVGMIPKDYEEIAEEEDEEEEDENGEKKKKKKTMRRGMPSRRFKSQELLELSIVPVPMNPTALRLLSVDEKELTVNKGMSFLYGSPDEEVESEESVSVGKDYSAGINLILKSCKESNERSAEVFEKLMKFMQMNNDAIVQFADVVKNLAYLHDTQELDLSSTSETEEKSSGDVTVAYLEDLLSTAKTARTAVSKTLTKEEKVSNES